MILAQSFASRFLLNNGGGGSGSPGVMASKRVPAREAGSAGHPAPAELEHMLLLCRQGSIQGANSVFHKRQLRFQFCRIAHKDVFVKAAPHGCCIRRSNDSASATDEQK